LFWRPRRRCPPGSRPQEIGRGGDSPLGPASGLTGRGSLSQVESAASGRFNKLNQHEGIDPAAVQGGRALPEPAPRPGLHLRGIQQRNLSRKGQQRASVTALATEVGIASHVPRCMTAPLRGPQQEIPFGLDYMYVPVCTPDIAASAKPHQRPHRSMLNAQGCRSDRTIMAGPKHEPVKALVFLHLLGFNRVHW
jgi:hypothetical protein